MEMQTWCMALNESSSKLPNLSNASGMTFDRGCVQGWKPLSSLGKVIDIHHGNKMTRNTYQEHVLVSNHQTCAKHAFWSFSQCCEMHATGFFFRRSNTLTQAPSRKNFIRLEKHVKRIQSYVGFILCQISVATYIFKRNNYRHSYNML